MSPLLLTGLLGLSTAAAAMCAGAETGFYAFSRLRHRLELERGNPAARRLERLFARPDVLLAALLLGTTLALEVVTFCSEALLEEVLHVAPSARATLSALVTAPLLFIVVEALPKHSFLARPYVLLARCSWPLDVLVGTLKPVAWLIARAVSRAEHGGAANGSAGSGIADALQHGLTEGLLTRAEHLLAANVLRLGDLEVFDLSVGLDVLPHLQSGAAPSTWVAALAQSRETRALVVDPRTHEVVGLVHALDLALAIGDGRSDVGQIVRAIPVLDGAEPMSAALGRLHAEGLAVALVRRGKGRPTRLLRLQDVVEELCGTLDRL